MSIRLGQNEVQNYLNVTTYEASIDPENFPTRDEVQGLINEVENKIPSLTGYATENFVSAKLADLIGEVPETLDTLEELADALSENEGLIAGLNEAIGKKASKEELQAISNSLSSYATQTWVESKGYLTQHQSLEGYAKESWVEERIAGLGGGSGGEAPDLTQYAKKTDLVGLATEEYVRNYISQELGEIDSLLDEIIGG